MTAPDRSGLPHMSDPDPEDVIAIKARYKEERAKRIREDGVGQYVAMKGKFADMLADPYADPDYKRAPLADEVELLVVGGGFGGLLAAARLREAGMTGRIRIVDKAGDFGGTWYWNRYPGAACDIEGYIYMPMLEETGEIPIEKYSKAPEILRHAVSIAGSTASTRTPCSRRGDRDALGRGARRAGWSRPTGATRSAPGSC